MSDPQTVEVESGSAPSASVIWLHGLGADGHDFEPIVPELRLPDTLPLRETLQGDSVDPSTPVFMAHGQFDPMIPMQYGRSAADALVDVGFDVDWHDYPMAHAVCPQEIDDIRTWLLGILS